MDDKYSPEEDQVNKLINESKARIQNWQEEIDNLPSDKGHEPTLEPEGAPRSFDPSETAKRKNWLEKEIEEEKNHLSFQVEQTLENSSKEAKERGMQNLTSFLYPTKNSERSQEKTLNTSQEFAMKLRFPNRTNDPIPRHERTQEKDLSTSQEFAHKLRFKDSPQVEKSEHEKTEPEKSDKTEMSMSMQFEQRLGFSQMEQASEPTDRAESREAIEAPEPDKD